MRDPNRRRPRPLVNLLLGSLAAMAVIVGAACQPLQLPEEDTALSGAAGAGQPDRTVPAAPDTAPRTAPGDGTVIPMAGLPARVALILPLSGRQRAVGEAVRDGFLAARLATGAASQPQLRIYDDAAVGGATAYRQALADGADAVVGPVLKDSVQAVAGVAGSHPTLALNFLADHIPAPPGFWQFGLSPEDEAREVAIRATALGQRRAIALAPDSELGRRLVNAFHSELVARGGQTVAWRFYDPRESDFSTEIRALLDDGGASLPAQDPAANPAHAAGSVARRRQDIDFIFMAANLSAGRQIAPQLRFFDAGDVPTYSTASIWEDGHGAEPDLEGIMFPDCPWVIAPDARASGVKQVLTRFWSPRALGLSRLYALGYDAHGLLAEILLGTAPGSLDMPGATGRLSASGDGRIRRRLPWVRIRGGVPVPLAPAGTSFP